MGDYLPSLKDIISNVIITLIISGLGWLWNHYRPQSFQLRIPSWLANILAVFTILTLIKISYDYNQENKPIEEHLNEKFDHQTIVLDNKSFRACEFTDCKLVINGIKPFKLNASKFTRSPFSLEKRAILGINILLMMKDSPELEPGVNAYFDLLKTKHINHKLPPTKMDE